MSVPQRQVLDRIRSHASNAPQRYPKYTDDLIKALADILGTVKSRPSDYVIQVEQRAQQLGDLIAHHENQEE